MIKPVFVLDVRSVEATWNVHTPIKRIKGAAEKSNKKISSNLYNFL